LISDWSFRSSGSNGIRESVSSKVLKKWKPSLTSLRRRLRAINAVSAYNRIASNYDCTLASNPLARIDERVVHRLLNRLSFTHKVVADYGCGTGRYFSSIAACGPARFIGMDVSSGMLASFAARQPDVELIHIRSKVLPLPDGEVDILLSNLVLGYVKDLPGLFAEWNRILGVQADLVLTDVHPVAASGDFRRIFRIGKRNREIKSFVHFEETIASEAGRFGFRLMRREEGCLTEDLREVYERQGAGHVFEATLGLPMILGLHFTRGAKTVQMED